MRHSSTLLLVVLAAPGRYLHAADMLTCGSPNDRKLPRAVATVLTA